MSNTRTRKPATTAATIDEILAAAEVPPQRTVKLMLNPALAAEIEELDAQLTALNATDARMSASPEATKLATKIEKMRAEGARFVVNFVVQKLPLREWRTLKMSFPARDGNKVDAVLGTDLSRFHGAAVRTCLVDPVVDDGKFDRLVDVMTQGQWNQLLDVVWDLNEPATSDVPFSQAASRIIQLSGASSARRPAGA